MKFSALLSSLLLISFAYVAMAADTTDKDFINDCLDAQNPFRTALGLKKLTWSSSLAAGALTWAKTMAKNSKLTHSKGGSYGENIAYGTTGYYTVKKLIGMWTAEKKYFIPGKKFPKCTTGGVVGH